MSKVQKLRALVNQRLTAAAQEIFVLFERTVAEYEEELCRSKEENERQRELLDAVFKPQLRLHRADFQQPLASKEAVFQEQQGWSPSLDQEDPEHLYVKEEQEEHWTTQGGEQLEGQEEADYTKFTLIPIPVKSEDDDEEKPQSSQFHQIEQIETEADGEDCEGPGPARNSDPDLQPDIEDKTRDFSETDIIGGNWKETIKPCSALRSHGGRITGKKQFPCSECGKTFNRKEYLMVHTRSHTGEKPFSCSVCLKRFSGQGNLKAHLRIHTGEKPFSCSVCGKGFGQKAHMQSHLRGHTGEKPYSCSTCDKCFARCEHLQTHMRTHTGEKPFKCRICDRTFSWRYQVQKHKCCVERIAVT